MEISIIMALTENQSRDIASLRATPATTLRATAPGIETVLHTPFPALDHGFVRVVDYMGDDAAICQAARVSYGAGTKSVSDDRGLIRYLMRHAHSTPFEMCEIKLHLKMPIFVARQWMRTRTASINEYSARYSILEREFYTPAAEDLAAQSSTNKQGREGQLDPETAGRVQRRLIEDAARAYDSYETLMATDEDGGYGLARELARMALPTSIYTQFYWKINLLNLMRFLRLRQDSHAQKEIRDYADIIGEKIIAPWVPHAHEAFTDYQRDATTLSGPATRLVQDILAPPSYRFKASQYGLTKREVSDLVAAIPALSDSILE